MAEQKEIPTGFQLPLFRALTEQLLLAGAPSSVIILNGALFVILVFILRAWYVFPLNIIIHFSAIYLTKQDDQFFDCFKRYINKKDYYST